MTEGFENIHSLTEVQKSGSKEGNWEEMIP